MKELTRQIFIERGPLWHVLEKVIQEREIDLIVLGTHGRRGLKKLVLGSVAEEVFRRARCPVMTIGPHTLVEGAAEGRIGTILYAVDSEEGTKESLPYALGLARKHQAKLVLLHVLPPMEEIPPAEIEFMAAGTRQQLLNLIPPVTELACPPEPIVVFGAAADEVLRVAQQQQAELIVMAVRRVGLSLAAAHLPWATAHRVVCEAPCPVLTIRH